MRLWCCFGFTEEEEEEEEERKEILMSMEDSKSDEFSLTDVGNEESENSNSRKCGAFDGLSDRERDRGVNESDECGSELWELSIGSSRNFDHIASSSGQSLVDAAEFCFDGETSLGLGRANWSQDIQHKRAKVNSTSSEHLYETLMSLGPDTSTVPAEGGTQLSFSSAISSGNEMVLCFSLNPNNTGSGNPGDNGRSDDIEGSSSGSKAEDLEVRMDLTDDLLHMVFSFLVHIDLCRAAGVCKQWRVASAHEDFWRCLNFKDRNISVTQFTDMCRRYPNATEVNVLGAPCIHLLAVKAMTYLRNLEVLILGKGQLNDNFFHALVECFALKSLKVVDATLGNGIHEVSVAHERLRQLHIIKCRVLRISVKCPLLEILSLNRTNMAHATLHCPQLQELDIRSCHKLSDAGIRSAATSCPLLTSLDMSNCSCVSDETLREIALACSNLSVLYASYCPNISLESVRLPMLTVLKLDNCEGITSASMAAISLSYNLEVLELDNCGYLTSVSLDLPHLRNIRLVHCRKFLDLNLQSPKLSSITVSNCPALHRINISSGSLQKLVLQKQESLSSLALQCQSLQEIDLSECESLTSSTCEVFGDGGGCPLLRSLVLDNCEAMTAVRLSSTSLISLSLTGCRAMTALELACPFLEQVSLDGCDHLERASFCPVGLRSLNLGICPKLNVLKIDAPQMVGLELKGCGVLSEASITCPCLTSLDASFCSQLRDDCLSATTTSCPLIESLILMSCPSVGPDGLSSLCWLEHLISLDLSYTFLTNLQPVYQSCRQLKVLKLQACKYLTNSSLEPLYKQSALPALRELDLSYGSLCQSAIEELLAYCTHLTHVSLNGCVNMHDLNWSYSNGSLSELSSITISSGTSLEDISEPIELHDRLLQNLNCVGCPNIKKVVIPSEARCVQLASLNLSLSANLKEVDVACFNLVFLNLSNCSSLEILKLQCPRLTSLFLQSCSISEEAVEAAISHCSMLETLDVRYCPKMYPVNMVRLRRVCPSLKRIFSSLSSS